MSDPHMSQTSMDLVNTRLTTPLWSKPNSRERDSSALVVETIDAEKRSNNYEHPGQFYRLAIYHYSKFKETGEIVNIDQAVDWMTKAISLLPQGQPELPARLEGLSRLCGIRYQHLQELADLDKSIDYRTRAVTITPEDDSELPILVSGIGLMFHTRFQRLGQWEDLDKAIEHLSRAVSLAPHNHADMPALLSTLGTYFGSRFRELGELKDQDKSIECMSQGVSLTVRDHIDMPIRLSNLASALRDRCNRLGALTDLNQAIEYESLAVSLTPQGSSDAPARLGGLGRSLQVRFGMLGEVEDLEKSAENYSQAASLMPQGDSSMLAQLSDLGIGLYFRFIRFSEREHLNKAIKYASQVVSLAPQGHKDMPKWLDRLGMSFNSRFEQLGELVDLDKAIDYHSQAVSLAPQGHTDMPKWIDNLGRSLLNRFGRLGKLADIDKAIQFTSEAVSLTPQDKSERPVLLSDLGILLTSRFGRLGSLEDLDTAIEYSSQALSLTTPGDLSRPNILINLGHSLFRRFQKLGERADLDNAIEHSSQAVSLGLQGHTDMPKLLNNLSMLINCRFEQLGELADLDKAIEYQEQAVSLTPQGHSYMPTWLSSLGYLLNNRFERLGKLADLDKAIENYYQAVSFAPHGHSSIPVWLNNLGLAFGARSKLPGMAKDIEKSLDCFQKATESSLGTPFHKFQTALRWSRSCKQHCHASLLKAYQQAMTLLPQIVWLGSAVDSRYNNISDLEDIATEAAAAAIKMKNYGLAVEWLEQGRSIVWKQMIQLRTPIDALATASPTLASKLEQTALDLDHASSPRATLKPILTHAPSLEQAAQEHHRLAERWEELLGEARSLPGFENFLCPEKATQLMQAAASSSVAMINVHRDQIDALVIQPGLDKISHIPLAISYAQVSHSRFQLEHYVRSRAPANRYPVFEESSPEEILKDTLAMLWIGIVKPVLDSLGYTVCPIKSVHRVAALITPGYQRTISTGNLPRITWCTTGSLSFLPLHAAGDYDMGFRVFDYVVSSYTPSLSTLLSHPSAPATFSGVLAVGQRSTLGLPTLPGTDLELVQIQEKTEGHIITILDGESATPIAVLNGMEKHSWVHLACHAMQNPTNPMQSAFYLHDGTLDLAAITQKQLKHADLAFLSACQTATGDERLSDEAVHLTAGMLMAGYRTAIATMWSIGDSDAPLIAEVVYEHLLEGGMPDSRKAAVAVHKATARLREKVGMTAFAKWVPYIHIGQ